MRAGRKLSLSKTPSPGNLVPVSQISNIVGKLPLLGNVLTGLDKSGIFATQFRVTGPSDDMKTAVNPASIAPGLMRDLVSPNWLAKESDRLFDAKPDKNDETDEAGAESLNPGGVPSLQ